MTTQNKESRIF